VPAWDGCRGKGGPVLLLPEVGGLVCRGLVRGGEGASEILAADPDGGQRYEQGEQRDSCRAQEPAGEASG
jgi:hypothetical protein